MNWVIKKRNADYKQISEKLGISEIMAKVIINRGIRSYEEAKSFLKPDISDLPSPFGITGMKEAVGAVLSHRGRGSKIAVYGDYDVDGVMSVSILSRCLAALNADFMYYVPDREKEGYGLNRRSVEELSELGVSLIIACDNGISAIDEAELIYERGMELVIIDHHEPYVLEGRDRLPKAEAIVDPKTEKCTYSFKSLCAGGLCFRFAQALALETGVQLDMNELLSFAAIATVCDIVELLGDNRAIVKKGLEVLNHTQNIGLKAIYERYELKEIREFHLGFIIGPTINASGRLESARSAIELLLADDKSAAKEIAEKLYALNISRKMMTENGFKRLCEQVEKGLSDRVFVLYDEEIHESVAGIVAGRIKDRYYHPVIVITKGEESAKGSARSIEGYNIYEALSEVSHLFLRFGGHSQAAGLSIDYERIDELRERLNSACRLTDSDFVKTLQIEERVPIDAVTLKMAESISVLAPYGKGNHEPIFAEKEVVFERVEFIGKEKRVLKFWVKNRDFSAISFDLCDHFLDYCSKRFNTANKDEVCLLRNFKMDIAFTVSVNEYKGKHVQLILKDFR